jgi:heat shock protein HslJ
MRRLVFALVLLVVIAACARQPQPDQSIPAEISGEWELVRGSIGGAAIPTPEGARVTLQIKDTELKGRAFCNIYHAQYRLTRGRLILDGLVSSEMGCESALMAAERTYLEVPRTDSDELVLVGEGVELQFTRADSTLP